MIRLLCNATQRGETGKYTTRGARSRVKREISPIGWRTAPSIYLVIKPSEPGSPHFASTYLERHPLFCEKIASPAILGHSDPRISHSPLWFIGATFRTASDLRLGVRACKRHGPDSTPTYRSSPLPPATSSFDLQGMSLCHTAVGGFSTSERASPNISLQPTGVPKICRGAGPCRPERCRPARTQRGPCTFSDYDQWPSLRG